MELSKLEDLEKYITILIVDDNNDSRKSLSDALEQEGYESIWTVETAEEAYNYLPKTNILLVDYQLPTSNQKGIELVEKAKKQYGDKIQAIVFSGLTNGFENVKQRTIAANAVAFFEKPLRTEYIKLWIKELSKRICLQQILDYYPDEVLIRSHNGTILYVNKEKEKIFGPDLCGDKCFLRFERRNQTNELCKRCPDQIAFDEVRRVRTEWDYITRGNKDKHKILQENQSVDIIAAPLLDNLNKPRAVIEISRDITIRKKAEKIIEEMIQEEDWKMRVKIFIEGFKKLGIPRARFYLIDERNYKQLFRLIEFIGTYDNSIIHKDKSKFNFMDDIPTKLMIDIKQPIIYKRDKENDNRAYQVDKVDQNQYWVGKNNIECFNELKKDEWIDIPLIANGNLLGKVSIDGWINYPDSYDLEVLERYCNSAGQIIYNARVFRDIDQREKIGKAILEISKEITNLTNRDELLKDIVRLTCNTMYTRDCSIFIYDEEEDLLKRVMSYGINKAGDLIERYPEELYKYGEYLTGWMFKRNKTAYNNNIRLLITRIKSIKKNRKDENLYIEFPLLEEYERIYKEKIYNCIFTPLTVDNKKIGVIRALNKLSQNDFGDNDFDKHDLEMFKLLAEQIAVAIFNANLQKEKEIVFSNVAHSLFSPLTSLKGFSELLADGVVTDPEKIKKYHKIIAEEAEHYSNLTKQVLNLSRIDANTFSFIKDYVLINELVEKVIERNKYLIEKNKINIITQLDPNINAMLYIDKEKMIDALQGIIDNAIKFSKSGSTIEIYSYFDDKNIFLKIKDHGNGIPESEIEKIWDRNYRGEYAKSSKILGSGIGLTVTKEIIKKHGGNINVESEVDVGSIFTISFLKK